MNTFEYQVNQFQQLIASPAGILAALAVLTLAILASSQAWARYFTLTLLIWSTTLTIGGRQEWFPNVLIFPLQQMRENTRTITLALLGVLLLPALVAAQGWRPRLISPPMVAFFVFQVVIALLDTALGDRLRGAMGLGIVTMSFLVFGRCVGGLAKDRLGAERIVIAVAAAGGLFALASAVQGIIDPDAVKWNGRFYATTANPQFASTTIGWLSAPVAYLLIQSGVKRWLRLAACLTLGLLAVFLLWTGSRTGLLMCLVGVALLFRLRLGKFFVAGAAAAVVLVIGLQFFGEEVQGADRLLSMQDTRTGAWTSMWRSFQGNPLLGGATSEDFGSENSYLWTAARYGLFGFLPLLVAVASYAWFCLKLTAAKRAMGKSHRLMADLVVAVIVVVGVGAMFEGYLLGQFNTGVYLLLTFTAVGQYLLDASAAGLAGDDDSDGAYGAGHGYGGYEPYANPAY